MAPSRISRRAVRLLKVSKVMRSSGSSLNRRIVSRSAKVSACAIASSSGSFREKSKIQFAETGAPQGLVPSGSTLRKERQELDFLTLSLSSASTKISIRNAVRLFRHTRTMPLVECYGVRRMVGRPTSWCLIPIVKDGNRFHKAKIEAPKRTNGRLKGTGRSPPEGRRRPGKTWRRISAAGFEPAMGR